MCSCDAEQLLHDLFCCLNRYFVRLAMVALCFDLCVYIYKRRLPSTLNWIQFSRRELGGCQRLRFEGMAPASHRIPCLPWVSLGCVRQRSFRRHRRPSFCRGSPGERSTAVRGAWGGRRGANPDGGTSEGAATGIPLQDGSRGWLGPGLGHTRQVPRHPVAPLPASRARARGSG